MVFKDRYHAGQLLATTLMMVEKKHAADLETVIAALPRGGVPVALELSKRLKAPIDILVSKKIGAPDQPEYAIGAVSSSGIVVMNPELDEDYLASIRDYVTTQRVQLRESTFLQESELRKRCNIDQLELKGKRVIIVDDGIATGMTTLAAIRTAKEKGASYVILAAPVIARDTLRKLHVECDLAVAVTVPERLQSIGDFYEDFHQVEERELEIDLSSSRTR